MYTEKVMDHFMHPRNVGEIDNASGRRHGRQREVRRHHAHLPGYRRESGCARREVQDLWLWRGDCDQFDGYGDDYWQDNSGGAGSDQQGSHGSAGRSAAGQGALLPAGRAGGAWPRCGIMRRRTTSPSRVSSRRSTTWTSWKKPTRTKLNLKIKKRIAFAVESNPFSYAVILPDWLHPALREWV